MMTLCNVLVFAQTSLIIINDMISKVLKLNAMPFNVNNKKLVFISKLVFKNI